jgi:serine/threonine-protein kinase HipA
MDNRPSLQAVVNTAEWYLPSRSHGAAIVTQMARQVSRWREQARGLGLARADIDLMASAFAQVPTAV